MSTNIGRPEQAVILAGGRGERLRPLTDTMPKPMIRFGGKPFLEYLLCQLREQGFKKVLLLLGYLPQVIQEYFGNGRSFGIQIDYHLTNEENDTGRRIKLAVDKFDSCFFLLYCDNYWPMRMDEMWKHYVNTDAQAMITVYTNKDNYTKNNVLISPDGMVVRYDKNRELDHLNGVEIGYAILHKDVVNIIPDKNVNFEKTLYPNLVEKQKLAAFVTDHRYYSVGSHARLSLTKSFLENGPVILLDRDGVLNKKAPKAQYVGIWEEFEWLPGAKEALGMLKSAGYTVIVITNQAGIGRCLMRESDLSEIHSRMNKELQKNGAVIDAFYYCPHGWDEGCDCRKPKPGMFFQAQRNFHLDLSRTFYIGDDIRDVEAGRAAGCPTLLVSSETSLLHLVQEKILQ